MIKRKDVIFLRERIDFLKKNTGFTLIELIVTIAVSTILLSVAVAGIVAWVHHSDFVRNENYAETIYYAAQAELTRYRGNGQLSELNILVRGEGDADVIGKVPENAIAGDKDKYKDRLYYLKKDAGPVDENNPLGELLSDYIYDGSIMEGTICVEFDPTDGTVYSVTYSDKNTSFTYGETAGEKEFSLLDRTRDVRKKDRVGYYSTDLSEAAPTAAGKTKVAEVQLVNEEQLYLKWSLPAQFDGIRKFLSYTIDIYDDKEPDTPKYTFVLRGRDLKEADASLKIKDDSGQQIAPGYILTVTGEKNKEDGTKESISQQFIAYSIGSEMYLVLDSIDYGAAEKIKENTGAENGFNTEELKNSASILQLFPEPKDIYIRIQAQGKPYKTSAWKQSNISNTLFAGMKKEDGFLGKIIGSDNNVYEIKNARHLYNVHYLEKLKPSTETQTTYYRQTGDVVWPVEGNRLFHSTSNEIGMGMTMAPLQDGDKPDGKDVPYFPMLSELRKSSVLEAEKGKNYELKGFVLYQKAEAASDEAEKGLGLIETNKGTVQRLTFTDATVQGIKNVGTVCGINEGRILDTAVDGTVKGKENVGGLVGLDKVTSDKTYGADGPTEDDLKGDSAYYNLTNYAEVTGSDGKVGGIVGLLNEEGQAYLCENYGAIKGEATETVYIGGITGYNKGLVQHCVSAPDDTPPKRMEDGELEQAALKGIFVGGIVGLNNGGTIRDSSTAGEAKDLSGRGGDDAYIIGYRYVGGIVGYNNSTVDGSGSSKGMLVNKQNCTNKASVIGHEYVGGIVGANGLLDKNNIISDDNNTIQNNKENYVSCTIKESYSSEMIVEDWVNEGLVEVVGSFKHDGSYDSDGRYAGGIAGYNAGNLKNCTTRMNTSSGGASNLVEQVKLYGKNASYVGGVAGYNVGYIYRESGTTSVNSVVSGKKYVGGIVGYNGTAAEGSNLTNSGRIENYELSGGFISAGSYAGGYVGLNTTEKLLSGTDGKPYMLKANPNEVTADYMAGGVMGALILAPENGVTAIGVNCATENFFGKVKAKYAFAGGYVGYTRILLPATDVEIPATDVEMRAEEQLLEKLTNAVNSAADQQQKLQNLANAILDERTQADGTAELQFTYETISESRFASIEAPIFAGGVIGCNSWNTKLKLQNIHNKVRVTATDSVTYGVISNARNKKAGEEQQDRFSFVGGIIGLVTPEAEIISCGNSGAGSVQGTGTYSGGIAEVNLGKISDCEAATVGNKDYYGGIVGLNTFAELNVNEEEKQGQIINCRLTGQISGGSYLGGIAACNESIIKDCKVEARTGAESESAVIGTGSYVGGIAAVNRLKLKKSESSTSEPEFYLNDTNKISDCEVNANIGTFGTGEFVGGLFGSYQGGELENAKVYSNNRNINIYGTEYVGGIAGEIKANLDGSKGILNCAAINAMNAAGGIGGMLTNGVSVEWCENRGMVRSMAGFAGGIVPEVEQNSIVRACQNKGSVEAVNQMAGGITAKNSGTITYGVKEGKEEIVSCTVESDSATITIKGTDSVGGIAGENTGRINECKIKGDVSVSDINAKGNNRAIGGIAGKNIGEITGANASEVNNKMPRITTLSEGSYLGGVAGTNVPNGVKEDSEWSGCIKKGTNGTVKLEVTLGTSQHGTVGGIAGANAGTITGMTFSGTVTGKSGSQYEYGTGGIVGRNEKGKAGNISGCSLSGGTARAISGNSGFGGHEDAMKGTYVGGICGVNPEEGVIAGCTLTGANTVEGDHGYVGGVVAYNLGEVSGSTNSGGKGTKIQNIENIENTEIAYNLCVIGGIAAYNGATGKLKNCSTGTWEISNTKMHNNMEKYPVGGIIGSNKSIYDQTGLTNNAAVSGGWMTGGIIGQQFTVLRGGFTIENCVNNGTVEAKWKGAGGIIGDWRGQSGSVRKCYNKAEVSITNYTGTNAAGGIIGGGWYGSDVAITIEQCGNDGKISTNKSGNSVGVAGGILGGFNTNDATFTITIMDCYNAAEIQNNAEDARAAGICVGDMQGSQLDLTITRCVNYGKGTTSGMPFSGITHTDVASAKITQCLNVGECNGKQQQPIARNISIDESKNYYFGNPERSDDKKGRQIAYYGYDEKNKRNMFLTDWLRSSFDLTNFRLKLGEAEGRYLQFNKDMNKEGDYTIEKLKSEFSADGNGQLLFGKTSGRINPPNNITLKESDNNYTVSYQADTDTLFCTDAYEVQIFAKKNNESWPNNLNDLGTPGCKITKITPLDPITGEPKSIYQTSETVLFKRLQDAAYTDIIVRMRARKAQSAPEGISGNEEGEGENKRIYSDWNYSEPLSTKPKLPTPRLHFEVIKGNNNNAFNGRWVLENAEEYTEYTSEYKITILDTGHGNKEIGTIARGKIKSDLCSYTERNEVMSTRGCNIRIAAYAEPTNSTVSYSRSEKFEKMLDTYPENRTLKAVNVGIGKFTGTGKGELGYEICLKQDVSNYEFVNITYKAELRLKGEKVGEGTVLLPNQRGEAYCIIDLSGMDDEDKIRKMIENARGKASDMPVTVCFYPWEMEEVKYYETDETGEKIVKSTVASNTGGFNGSYKEVRIKGLNCVMHPAPKPKEGTGDKNILEPDIAEDGTIAYTLYWDMINNGTANMTEDGYDNAEYKVTVTGKSGDTEVILYPGTDDTVDSRTRKIVLKDDNWKYQQLILTVERLGKEADETNQTHYIGASVKTEYTIPIRLNSVQGLNASLPDDGNSLAITVGWVPSAEDGVGGYKIIMRGEKDGETITKTITTMIPADAENIESIQIDLDEKDADGNEIYKDFKGINVLKFSIAAVPKENTDYMESRESDTYSLTIPPRLNTPKSNPKLMRGNTEIDNVTELEPEAFTEFLLQLEDAGASTEDATYQVEYFITDKDAETGLLKDWDQSAGDRWEKNEENGIYISAISKMDGNLQSAKYELKKDGFDAQQAGRTIWYRVRAVSNNKISSVWTAWENKDLPKVLLEPVEIPEDQTADGKYKYTIVQPDGTAGVPYELSIRQPKAGFAPVEFAEGYEIYIQEAKRTEWVFNSDSGEMEETTVEPDPRIYTLEEAETAFDGTEPQRPFKLTYKNGENGGILDDGIQDVADIENGILEVKTSGGEKTYIYTLYTVIHSYRVGETPKTAFIYSIPVDAKLCYRTKDNVIQEIWLELPEGVALTSDEAEVSDRQFIATSLVDVTVIPPDEDRYVVNELTRWRRDPADNSKIEIVQMSVTNARNDRTATAGYYEDMLFLDEMSDRQLKLFRLKREDFLEEEEVEEDVSGNDVSGNDVTAEDDKTSGNDTKKEDPEKPEGGESTGSESEKEPSAKPENGESTGSESEKEPSAKPENGESTGSESEKESSAKPENGESSGSGTEEKSPAKTESGKDKTQGNGETSENSVKQDAGGGGTSKDNTETDQEK